jgi:hypothetical protein
MTQPIALVRMCGLTARSRRATIASHSLSDSDQYLIPTSFLDLSGVVRRSRTARRQHDTSDT